MTQHLETGLKPNVISPVLPKEMLKVIQAKDSRKIILRQEQSPGDILTFTNALGDLARTYPDWLIDVRTPCPEIFENNPFLTPLNEKDPSVEMYVITYDDINISGWNGLHYTDAFRNDIERKLNSKRENVERWGITAIKKTGIKPELYISDLEKSWMHQAETTFGWNGPFWLINGGRKQDNELKYYHRWQEVVDLLNDYFTGRAKIIQIGHQDHLHPPLQRCWSVIGQTDLRQLIRLCHWAVGTIGPLSFQFVMSAAFEQPAVVVCGGKEGVRWHLYPHIRHIYTNGALKCCDWDGCWLGGPIAQCKDLVNGVPHCFRLIKPYQIVDAVAMYYDGGRLSF